MVDMHSHILPFIDDGSVNEVSSFEMIEKAIQDGVKHIVLTPHAFRPDIKKYSLDFLNERFNSFKEKAESKYDIKLYLGQEVYCTSSLISLLKNKEIQTMNNTEYILLELPFNYKPDNLDEIFYSCSVLGYKVILAHIERYDYLKIQDVEQLAKQGILMQTNSNSLFSSIKRIRVRAHRLLKKNLVSFIASDLHSFRVNSLKKAYDYVAKKYSNDLALKLFRENAKEYLNIG